MKAFFSDFHRKPYQTRRLHIVNETGRFAGREGLCGAPGWAAQRPDQVNYDVAPSTPPDGVAWCPTCVGKALEALGMINEAAAACDARAGAAVHEGRPTLAEVEAAFPVKSR